MRKLRWGIIGSAKIATQKVIPALQRCERGEVVAIASRDAARAEAVSRELGIATAHGSYQALLDDPEVDAVYNPLPNHLHVPLSERALDAGKHVLCEKPIALDANQAERLLAAAAARPQLKVMEAFMYRFHPQWQRAKTLVDNGALGELRAVQTFFSYFNDDPANVRNQADIGGGGLMDIGCYPISQARFLFGREPEKVCATLDLDPRFGVDHLASAILDFGGSAMATFTCATQLAPFQRVQIVGTEGRVEIEIPVNAPPDRPTRLWLARGGGIGEESFAVCDQYTLQGDAFAGAVLDDTPVPTPLADALANMRVIDAIRAAAAGGGWQSVPAG